MNPLRFLGPGLLVLGFASLALAVARGEATAYLVVVFPVVVGTGPLALTGIVLVFVGFFATFLFSPFGTPGTEFERVSAPASESPHAPEVPTRRWGGVVFLGPFPIVFGSDPRMTRLMLFAGVLLFVALLALMIFALFA